MTLFYFAAHILIATLFGPKDTHTRQPKQPTTKPPLVIVTDQSWEVGKLPVQVGKYPLSADLIASATSPLYGGNGKPVVAEYNERCKIIPGTIPIWRQAQTTSEGEAFQFRKTVLLGNDPIQKATLEINCDDVARVYINKRLVSVEKRDGTIKDGYDRWLTFRSVTGFTQSRVYTYDVTNYFFRNVNNSIFVEAASLAFDGSHAYISAKITFEFAPVPEPTRPVATKEARKVKPENKIQTSTGNTPVTKATKQEQPLAPEKIVFEDGNTPTIEALHIGSVLELGHLHFKTDDYHLDANSHRTLDALTTFLKKYRSLKIEVGGHTNLRPSDRFAAALSTNRARSVARYLTDNGISADRVTYKGYGKSQPKVNEISKAADQQNQRVEIKVLAK